MFTVDSSEYSTLNAVLKGFAVWPNYPRSDEEESLWKYPS